MSNCKTVGQDWARFVERLGFVKEIENYSPEEIIFRARYNILDLYYDVDGETWDLYEDINKFGFLREDLDFEFAHLSSSSGQAAMIRWLYDQLYGQPKSFSPFRGYRGSEPGMWMFNHEYEEIPVFSEYGLRNFFQAIWDRLTMAELAALYTSCTGARKQEWSEQDLKKKTLSALTKLKEDRSFKAELETIASYAIQPPRGAN